MVLALCSPRRLARRLHRGQQQGHEHANDGDYHEKLDQCEADRTTPIRARQA
jgi:hypothetical protein